MHFSKDDFDFKDALGFQSQNIAYSFSNYHFKDFGIGFDNNDES